MSKKSSLKIALEGKCPRCHKGSMFIYPAYNIFHFGEMNEECPICDLRFEREPGYWFGAMYVSYGFSVAIVIVLGMLTYYLFDNPDMWVYSTIIFTTVFLLVPLLFRYSRIVYLHVFGGIKYKEGPYK